MNARSRSRDSERLNELFHLIMNDSDERFSRETVNAITILRERYDLLSEWDRQLTLGFVSVIHSHPNNQERFVAQIYDVLGIKAAPYKINTMF